MSSLTRHRTGLASRALVKTFFTVNSRARLRRAGPSGPGRALGHGRVDHQGECVKQPGPRRWRPGVAGESRRCEAAAWPAASSAAAHRRGPLPPRRYPTPATWRSPPSRTLVTAPARAGGPSSSRRASCRRESSQSRALPAVASLRFAPGRRLTAIFHGKEPAPVGRTGEEPRSGQQPGR
jgi:hypothetical protein